MASTILSVRHFIEGVQERDVEQVRAFLDFDEAGQRKLTADDCFEALEDVISSSICVPDYPHPACVSDFPHLIDPCLKEFCEEASELILRYAQNVYEEEVIMSRMDEKQILFFAVRSASCLILKRILEVYEKRARNIKAHDCFQAIKRAYEYYCNWKATDGCAVILDYAEKTYDEETIISQLEEKEILISAVTSSSGRIVRKILEADEKRAKNLTAEHCFKALFRSVCQNETEITQLILNYAKRVYSEDIKEMFELVESGTQPHDQVKNVLEAYGKGTWELTAHDCFSAIDSDHEENFHLILDFAEKFYSKEVIAKQITENDLIDWAIRKNIFFIAKRLAGTKVPASYDRLHIRCAFICGHPEIAELLISTGCSPLTLLDLTYGEIVNAMWFEFEILNRPTDTMHTEIDRTGFTGGQQKVWQVILPHFTVDDVMQSKLLASTITSCAEKMLLMLEELGMDISSYISACGVAVLKFLQHVLYPDSMSNIIVCSLARPYDKVTLQFLLNRGFDVNASIESKPLLHHLIDLLRNNPYWTNAAFTDTLDAIQRGANPLLKNSSNQSAIDICIDNYCDSKDGTNRSVYANILKLLVRIGFRIPEDRLISITAEEDDLFRDAITENKCAPSLRCLCRRVIRVEKGSRISEFMAQYPPDQLPQQLKEFILLKDIDFTEFQFQ